MEEYSFERISVDKLPELVELFRQAFKLQVDLNFLSKKFDTSYTGISFIGYLARHKGGGVAAYYGVFPILCEFKGETLLAAQSGDTMTHPLHQGKGLFTKLALLTYELAEKEGIHFVFGFPNKNSYPGFVKKLNWNHYANINTYVIPVSTLPVQKVAKKFLIVDKFYRAFLNLAIKNHPDNLFQNSLLKQLPDFGCVLHDKAFFEYKKYYRSYQLTISGVPCVVKIDGRLWVGDLGFCNEIQFNNFLNHLKNLAKKIGCSSIHFSFFENSFFDLILKKRMESNSTVPVGAVNLSKKFDEKRFAYQAFDFDTF